jgi:chromosome partitioning protein
VPVVAIINRKGGCGKSTLATNLAGYLSLRGTPVMLGDVDSQQSTVPWLKRRTQQTLGGVAITGWTSDANNVLRPPPGVAHVVLDTPGGLRGFDMNRLLAFANAVLIPVCDSAFDRESAAECFAELKQHPRVASGRCLVAAVGMRVDARTRAEQTLRAWAEQLGLPFLGALRASQSYVRCAERGLTIFDLPGARTQADVAQWQPVLQWLTPVFDAVPNLAPTRPPRLVVKPTPRTAAGAASREPMLINPVLTRQPLATLSTGSPGRGPLKSLMRLVGWLMPQRAGLR